MIHLFKVSDGSWVFSGSVRPSNMKGDDYVEGVLPEGETWDANYEYTCVDGVATKGDLIEWDHSALEADEAANAYKYARKEAYPSIEDQLDDIYHNGIEGWKETIKSIKDAHPKP
jgi:hypothetical protein